MGVEGLVFDLLFVEVLLIKWVEGLTVVAHSFRSMATHVVIFWPLDLAIFLVQPIVERGLFDHFPRILDQLGREDCRRIDGYRWLGNDNAAIEFPRTVGRSAIEVTVGQLLPVAVADEELVAVSAKVSMYSGIGWSSLLLQTDLLHLDLGQVC